MSVVTAGSTPAETITQAERTARAIALIERICGPSDARADFVVSVLDAQAEILSWIREQTGVFPTPRPIWKPIDEAATQLRSIVADGYVDEAAAVNPAQVLGQVARDALAEYRASDRP
jgi:hypothetical protein